MTNDNASLLARAWRTLKAFDEALDYSVDGIVLAKLENLENEVRRLSAIASAHRPSGDF